MSGPRVLGGRPQSSHADRVRADFVGRNQHSFPGPHLPLKMRNKEVSIFPPKIHASHYFGAGVPCFSAVVYVKFKFLSIIFVFTIILTTFQPL